MIFRLKDDDTIVRLDRSVPGDGTDWYADIRCKSPHDGRSYWSADDYRLHPGDLGEQLPDG